jgi:hypothetical protein
MRRKAIIAIGVLAVAGVAYFKDDIRTLWDGLHVHVVEYPATKPAVWLDQGVSKKDLRWFYHADQGTRTFMIPYDWFMALEQPTVPWLLFTRVGAFHETEYLDRFGFIPDTVIPNDPAPLPIGFAKGTAMLDGNGAPFRNPHTKEDMKAIGLTCSACHTGRFSYKGTPVVVDGGSALTNLFQLQNGIGLSLVMTRFWPGRFARFADAILGSDSALEERMTLRDQLDLVLKQYNNIKNLEAKVEADSVDEGYGRLDALNRIGNQVFSLDLNNPANYAAHSAPVHFPRIWNAPWFDWVQYNASIMQPMIRNAGESLGVASDINLTDPSKGLFKSSVNLKTLHEIEMMIAGDAPIKEFSGLKSPSWPKDIFPPPDPKLVETGGKLYAQYCQECHLPPTNTREFWENREWWTTNDNGQPILKLKVKQIGTDMAQAQDMRNRTVAIPSNLGIVNNSFGLALSEVVAKVVNYVYDQEKLPEAERQKMNGYRPNDIQAPLKYKARPLNGVWATPPYLHNASVPTIEDLLGPADKRPTVFYLGSREYNPDKLGYETEKDLQNSSRFDTGIRGNSNRGHEFSNTKGPAVIGDALDTDQRKALIAFLKTL